MEIILSYLTSWGSAIGAVVALIFGAYFVGGRNAKKDARLKQDAKLLDDKRKADEVDKKLDALSDNDIRNRASKWVR